MTPCACLIAGSPKKRKGKSFARRSGESVPKYERSGSKRCPAELDDVLSMIDSRPLKKKKAQKEDCVAKERWTCCEKRKTDQERTLAAG
jgi:hypothetical protein